MKKLDKALGDVLQEQYDMPTPDSMLPPEYDVRAEAEIQKYHLRRFASGISMDQSGEAEEPEEKILIAIQHHFINGDFQKANDLIQNFRSLKGNKFFTWHHMNQLLDWVRNVYKYTNMKDLSRNYYQHEMTKDMEIQGVSDLAKVKVRDEIVEKFIKDAEKVLKKKLQMR